MLIGCTKINKRPFGVKRAFSFLNLLFWNHWDSWNKPGLNVHWVVPSNVYVFLGWSEMQKRGRNVSKWYCLFLTHFSETTGQFGLFIGMFCKKSLFVDRMYTKETRCQKGCRLFLCMERLLFNKSWSVLILYATYKIMFNQTAKHSKWWLQLSH